MLNEKRMSDDDEVVGGEEEERVMPSEKGRETTNKKEINFYSVIL